MLELCEIKKGNTGYGLLIEKDFGSISNQNNAINEDIGTGKIGEKSNDDEFIFPVVFQKFGIENANRRIYPEKIIKAQVEKYMTAVKDHLAIGEANHPDTTTLDIDRLSHLVTDLEWQGHTLIGHIKLLVSPGYVKYGVISNLADLCANHIRCGVKLGVSSRGVGSLVDEDGKAIVQDDFELICFDIVTEPSTPNAWIVTKNDDINQYVESKQRELSDKLNKFLL